MSERGRPSLQEVSFNTGIDTGAKERVSPIKDSRHDVIMALHGAYHALLPDLRAAHEAGALSKEDRYHFAQLRRGIRETVASGHEWKVVKSTHPKNGEVHITHERIMMGWIRDQILKKIEEESLYNNPDVEKFQAWLAVIERNSRAFERGKRKDETRKKVRAYKLAQDTGISFSEAQIYLSNQTELILPPKKSSVVKSQTVSATPLPADITPPLDIASPIEVAPPVDNIPPEDNVIDITQRPRKKTPSDTFDDELREAREKIRAAAATGKKSAIKVREGTKKAGERVIEGQRAAMSAVGHSLKRRFIEIPNQNNENAKLFRQNRERVFARLAGILSAGVRIFSDAPLYQRLNTPVGRALSTLTMGATAATVFAGNVGSSGRVSSSTEESAYVKVLTQEEAAAITTTTVQPGVAFQIDGKLFSIDLPANNAALSPLPVPAEISPLVTVPDEEDEVQIPTSTSVPIATTTTVRGVDTTSTTGTIKVETEAEKRRRERDEELARRNPQRAPENGSTTTTATTTPARTSVVNPNVVDIPDVNEMIAKAEAEALKIQEEVRARIEAEKAAAEKAAKEAERAALKAELESTPGPVVFPLDTTKEVITNNPRLHWCHDCTTNKHHTYNAADIFAPTGTPVLAARGGRVLYSEFAEAEGPGNFGLTVKIVGDDGLTYYYAHMDPDRHEVKKGDVIPAGTVIGYIGSDFNAQVTPMHLHVDIGTVSESMSRPGPLASKTLMDMQGRWTQTYQLLPDS